MIGTLIFMASIVIACGGNTKIAEESDKELLQGAWVPVALAKNGKVMTMEQRRREGESQLKRVVFSGDGCTSEMRRDEETVIDKAKWLLRTWKTPKQIDLVVGPETIEAIYSVTADELRICIGDGARRPTAFKTKGEPNFQLWIFKREKSQGSSSQASQTHHGK